MDTQEELNELYKQYGEIVMRLEFFQQKYLEIKNKILQLLAKQNNINIPK